MLCWFTVDECFHPSAPYSFHSHSLLLKLSLSLRLLSLNGEWFIFPFGRKQKGEAAAVDGNSEKWERKYVYSSFLFHFPPLNSKHTRRHSGIENSKYNNCLFKNKLWLLFSSSPPPHFNLISSFFNIQPFTWWLFSRKNAQQYELCNVMIHRL